MKRAEKICDVCGRPFEKGIKIFGFKKRNELMCDKCENVFKLMILKYRRAKEI